jgi:hypothetical protein
MMKPAVQVPRSGSRLGCEASCSSEFEHPDDGGAKGLKAVGLRPSPPIDVTTSRPLQSQARTTETSPVTSPAARTPRGSDASWKAARTHSHRRLLERSRMPVRRHRARRSFRGHSARPLAERFANRPTRAAPSSFGWALPRRKAAGVAWVEASVPAFVAPGGSGHARSRVYPARATA